MRDTLLWRKTLPLLLQAHAEVSDAELLRRYVATNDAAAFELLLHRHGPLVWATALRIVRQTATAEDVFQATFWALAQHAGRLRAGTALAAWLHRVALRASVDVLRRVKPTTTLSDFADATDPAITTQNADTRQTLDVAINRLPEKLRRAFILCVLEEHTATEAATMLGIPVGTVESRLSRAKQRLRVDCATLGSALVAVPAALLTNTLNATTTRSITPLIQTLAKQATPTPNYVSPLVALVMLTSVVALAFGMGQPEPPAQKGDTPKPAPLEKKEAPAKTPDADPLPEGAIARFGSAHFRTSGGSVMRFTPDGRTLAVAETNRVTLFDVATGKKLRFITLPEKQKLTLLRFIHDGKQLALGTSDYQKLAMMLHVDSATGKTIAEAKFTGTQQIFVRDTLADGSQCLVADSFTRVFLWDMTTSKEVGSTAYSEPSIPLFLNAGKEWLLPGSRQTDVYETATGKVVRSVGHPKAERVFYATRGTISTAGQMGFLSRGSKNVVVVHTDGKTAPRSYETKHEILSLDVSASGRFLIAWQESGTQVWDLHGKEGAAPVANLPGAYGMALADDDRTLALATHGLIALYDTTTWKPLTQAASPPTPIDRLAISPDGQRLLAHTLQGWQYWPMTGGDAVRVSEDTLTATEGITGVAVNGPIAVDVLATASTDSDLRKYLLRVTNLATKTTRLIPTPTWLYNQPVLSADGRFVSVALENKTLGLWDTTTGEQTATLACPKNRSSIGGYEMAPDGKSFQRLITTEYAKVDPKRAAFAVAVNAAVFVTDLRTGDEWTLTPTPEIIHSGGARFSADGTKLIVDCGSADRKTRRVLVWDVATRQMVLNWPIGNGVSTGYQLAPDQRSLATRNADGTLSIVEIASQQARINYKHESWINAVAFHPSGWQVVAASSDAPVYVWDLLGKPGPWDATKADTLWTDLGSDDAKKAFAVMRVLHVNPTDAIAFLRDRIQVSVPEEAKYQAWLRQLDSDEFRIRENAQKELTNHADVLLPHLEAAKKTASDEKKQRLDTIIKSATTWTPDRYRYVRACESLEGLRTPEAKKLLEAWVKSASARLASEAKDSLRRMAK